MRVLLIVGPTAVGKSRLALLLAEKLGGEIISADSRQIYRFMDIGTAKPPPEDRQRVPHHFIDIKYPDEPYNAGQFGIEGREKIDEVFARGRTPIVVGGSGLYIRSLVDGLFQGPLSNHEIRKKLRERADQEGLDKLYQYLKDVDQESARRIHPNDRQRILRALEVYEITGVPISKFQKEEKIEVNFVPEFFGLRRQREELYRLIEERVDRMMERGFVEEVEGLLNRGYSGDLNSMRTVGYQQIIRFLKGEMDLQQAVELIKKNTRNYAKRQLTWFSRDQRIRWIDVDETTDWERVADEIIKNFRK